MFTGDAENVSKFSNCVNIKPEMIFKSTKENDQLYDLSHYQKFALIIKCMFVTRMWVNVSELQTLGNNVRLLTCQEQS